MIKHIIIVFGIILSAFNSFAQTDEESIEIAAKLFEEGKYIEATPHYLKLLSHYPKDANYNFRYGTCLLFNSDKKNDALRYLSYAVKDEGIDARAYYFHGKALHLNYQFQDAIKSYRTYLQKTTGNSKDKRYDAELQIKMCENGKTLLTSFTDIIVAKKVEISSEKFFQLYTDTKTIGGTILMTAEFQSKYDKKVGHIPIVHFPPNAKAIYYSSYGDNGSTGLDIYIRRRLPDGTWGDPQKLPGKVNTSEDEDFPYMHPGERFLYFSSKGHNSMGGYDIFYSQYHEETNDFGEPKNVDFAISSPDDDLFYVVDSAYQNAYFASARQSQNGMLHVYRVKVARVPIQEIIIMGDFLSEINPDNKKMHISLKNLATGNPVGEIRSNDRGKYSFVFPSGGKYEYVIDVEGSQSTYTYTVELPFLEEFRPLKQKVIHTNENGQEIVKIVNLFDEKVEGGEELIAEVIRKKAQLEVNIDKFDMDKIEKDEQQDKILAEMGFANMTATEIASQLEIIQEEEERNTAAAIQIERNVDAKIVANSERIQELTEQQAVLDEKIKNSTDPSEKHNLLTEAHQMDIEKSNLTEEIQNLNIFKEEMIERISGNAEPQPGKMMKIQREVNSYLNSEQEDKALKVVVENQKYIQAIKNGSPDQITKELVAESQKINAQLDAVKKQEREYDKQIDVAQNKISLLENQIQGAKKKEAEEIQSQIDDLNEEKTLYQGERDFTHQEIIRVNKELNKVDSKLETLQNTMQENSNKPIPQEEIYRIVSVFKDENNNKLTYYSNQIAALESEHPELNPRNTSVNQSSVIEQYNAIKETEIDQNTSLTPIERIYEKLENNKRTIDKIEERQEILQEALNNDPGNSALLSELNTLNELSETLHDENSAFKDKLQEMKVMSPDVAVSEEIIIAEIAPGYDKKIQEIRKNTSYSEIDKLLAYQKEDEELLIKVNTELNVVSNALKSKPEDTELIGRKQILEEIKQSKTKEMNKREVRIETLQSQPVQTDINVVKTKIREEIAPEYLTNKNAILQSNSSELDKTTKLLTLEKDYLENLTDKKAKLNKQLSTTPDDQLRTELEAVNALISDQEKIIVDLSLRKETLENQTEIVVNPSELLTEIAPQYESRINGINKDATLAEKDRLSKLITEEEKLLSEIKSEIEETNDKLIQNPVDQALLNRKSVLEQMEQASDNQIAEYNQQLDSFERTPEVVDINEVKSNLLVEANPDYSSEKTEIQGSNKSELEKTNELIALETNLLQNLKEKQAENKQALNNDPGNAKLQTEAEALNSLISQQENAINDLNQKKSSLEKQPEVSVTSNDVLAEIAPEYQANKLEIQSDASLSEKEKLTKLKAEEEKLRSEIKSEIEETNDKLIQNPGDQALLNRKSVLELIEQASDNQIAEYNQQLDNLELTPEVVDINEVKSNLLVEANPDYSSEKTEIQGSNKSELEKTNELIALESNLLQNLKEKQAENKQALTNDPGNAKLQTEAEALNSLISQQENAINDLNQKKSSLEKQPEVSVTSNDVLAEIAPVYESNKSGIQSDASLSEKEKLTKLKAEEEKLQSVIKSEIEETNDKLIQDPSDQTLLKRKSVLEQMEQASDNQIAEYNQQLDSLERTPEVVDINEVKSNLLVEANPDYSSEKTEILGSNKSELEKTNELIALETNLLQNLKEKQAENKQALTNDPGNAKLQTEAEALNSLISQQENAINDLNLKKSALETQPEVSVTSNDVLAEIAPEYQANKLEIQSDASLSEKEKLTKLKAEEEKLRSKIKSEIEETNDKLIQNPGDQALLNRKSVLEQMEQASDNQIAEYNQQLHNLERTPEVADINSTKESISKELIPNYESDKQQILNSSQSIEEKNIALMELEKAFIDGLKQKEKELAKEIENGTNDSSTQIKRDAIRDLLMEHQLEFDKYKIEIIDARLSDEGDRKYIDQVDAKFIVDSENLLASENPNKQDDLANREVVLQNKLRNEIENGKKQLDRKYSITLDVENSIYERLLEESIAREDKYKHGETPEVEIAKNNFINETRKEYFGENNDPLTKEYTTVAELKAQEIKLAEYENDINEKVAAVQIEIRSNTKDENLKNELNWLQEEKELVAKKRRNISITIGDLEMEVIAETNAENEDAELQAIDSRTKELEMKLNSSELSANEKKAIEKELTELGNKKVLRENELYKEDIDKGKKESEDLTIEIEQLISQNPNTGIEKIKLNHEKNNEVVEAYIQKSNKARSAEEKNYLLQQASQEQKASNEQLAESVSAMKIRSIEETENIRILSKDELEKRKRSYSIEIGDLNADLIAVNNKISTANKKELPALEAEREGILTRIEILNEQLSQVEHRLNEIVDPQHTLDPEALTKDLTFNKEREIASKDEYANYKTSADKALQVENEISNLESQLKIEQDELLILISAEKTPENQRLIDQKVNNIKVLQSGIDQRNTVLKQLRLEADQHLPENREESMLMQNLVSRGIEPIKVAVIAASMINLPASGITIDKNAESAYTAEKPIPVGLKEPGGLVYRVQVGAFKNPIPQDLFREFNPVSGEIIGNTGITRYMAGFFGDNEEGNNARDQIRALGYADAFVVAYCDGERISVAEARKRQAEGTCVAKGQSELLVEVAQNTVEQMGITPEKVITEVPEISYHLAPGAADAQPIEIKKGLFYTVQVGVFNKPVAHEALYNLDPLLTLRLPNGQIRYSVGMYNSVDEARPMKQSALDKGIQGAFITAYYNGERISLAEAEKILAEKGTAVLQSNMEKEIIEIKDTTEIETNVIRTDTVSVETVEYLTVERPKQFIQIVTKKQFEEYPRDVLNRYNAAGSFYFDQKDRRVKSVIYNNPDDLPRIYYFRDDIDTVYLNQNDIEVSGKEVIIVRIDGLTIPGDFNDWLLRFNYRRETNIDENGIEIKFYDIEPEVREEVLADIRIFGLNPEVRLEADELIEEK